MQVPPPELVTVTANVVVSDRLPEVPVMVAVEVLTVAVALAVSVSVLPLNVPVTPAGSPETARATAPVKPLMSVTVTASVAVAPCSTETAPAVSEKLPGLPPPPPLQATPLTARLVGTALVLPFQVPLKPMPVTLPPTGTLPL